MTNKKIEKPNMLESFIKTHKVHYFSIVDTLFEPSGTKTRFPLFHSHLHTYSKMASVIIGQLADLVNAIKSAEDVDFCAFDPPVQNTIDAVVSMAPTNPHGAFEAMLSLRARVAAMAQENAKAKAKAKAKTKTKAKGKK